MAKQAEANFGKQFEQLEKIAESFENGEVDIDEGLKKFEEGLAIAKKLKLKLKEVENKIEIIKKKFED